MSAFTGGGHGKGAMRAHRAAKRADAAARDAALCPDSMKRRQVRTEVRATADRLDEAKPTRRACTHLLKEHR